MGEFQSKSGPKGYWGAVGSDGVGLSWMVLGGFKVSNLNPIYIELELVMSFDKLLLLDLEAKLRMICILQE